MLVVQKAIAFLEKELAGLDNPPVGDTLWYLVQAKSLGLSLLKAAVARKLDPAAIDHLRKQLRAQLITLEQKDG